MKKIFEIIRQKKIEKELAKIELLAEEVRRGIPKTGRHLNSVELVHKSR